MNAYEIHSATENLTTIFFQLAHNGLGYDAVADEAFLRQRPAPRITAKELVRMDGEQKCLPIDLPDRFCFI